MTGYNLWLLIIIGIMSVPSTMEAQVEDYEEIVAYDEDEEYGRIFMGELTLLLANPKGKVDQRVDNISVGIYGSFFVQFKPEKPLFFGAQLGFQYIDSHSDYFIDFSAPDPYEIESSTMTGLFFASLSPRFYTGFSPKGFQTYIEADLGANIIYTSTSTSALDFDETSFTFNESDFAVRYGMAIGTQYVLYETLYLNLKIGYQSSLSTTYYYHDQDLPLDNASSSFDLFSKGSGPISAVTYHIGVTNTF